MTQAGRDYYSTIENMALLIACSFTSLVAVILGALIFSRPKELSYASGIELAVGIVCYGMIIFLTIFMWYVYHIYKNKRQASSSAES